MWTSSDPSAMQLGATVTQYVAATVAWHAVGALISPGPQSKNGTHLKPPASAAAASG